jgi:hypothetical protein
MPRKRAILARFRYTGAMKSTQLRTNIVGLNVSIAKAGMVTLATCVVVTVTFRSVIGLGLNIERYLIWALWVLLPGMWVIGSMIRRDKWRKSSYMLTDDALVVSSGNMLGGGNRQMYRYDAIISVNIRQGALGNRYGYGDVSLEIPRLGRDVVLQGIADPHMQIKELKSRISQHSQGQRLSAI